MTDYEWGMVAGAILMALALLFGLVVFVLVRDLIDDRAWHRRFKSKTIPRVEVVRDRRLEIPRGRR